ncbi:hypothetical protein [Orenia marismortui]|uniref:Uncharacterized protein n=1 Tax=Orenia marismortui TaxID=46469 RepID=A0A4R8H2J1_9FIRM|nr:hypothetical protein [Orenia marismortui]TDX48830.1 hypothetical protein C7959_1259 [Orenia marismortui]
MSKIFYLVFIFPGFLILAILKMIFRGFGKNFDVFDKTLYSLFFNIPIFLITILVLNCNFIIDILKNINKDFNGLKKINQLKDYFSQDIMMLISLVSLMLVIAILVAILWCVFVNIFGKINNKIRDYEIFNYTDVWNSSFVEDKESIPVEIYKQDTGGEELIVAGFLEETSVSLEEDTEFKIIKIDSFNKCKDKGLLDEIDYVYYNSSKDIKINVFKTNKIDDFLKE